jgi:hypothetical protein
VGVSPRPLPQCAYGCFSRDPESMHAAQTDKPLHPLTPV